LDLSAEGSAKKSIKKAGGNDPPHIVRTAQKSPYGKLNQTMNWLRNSSGVSFVLS